MLEKLSIIAIFKSSFQYIAKNYALTAYLFIFSFTGIYLAQRLNAPHNFMIMSLYLTYVYLFYFFFTRIYFNKKPLFNREAFTNALVRILAILLLAFACILLLRIAIQLMILILSPLQFFPSISGFIKESYNLIISSHYFLYVMYGLMFLLLTATFFIPAMAWVSAAIGQDSSITLSLIKTKGNYARLFGIFLLVYGILPFAIILFAYDSLFIRTALSSLFTVVQFIIYLNIYQFFYLKNN